MKRFFVTVGMAIVAVTVANACTNFIVGKKASTDGSVMVTYNDDSFGKYGSLWHFPAGKHPKGSMRQIVQWGTGKYLGEIPEAAETYNVIGNINEYQLCICETTFGGRPELVNHEGILDYGSLMYIALQRAKTAREAIKVMTELVAEHGYYSSGESLSIADKNEAWIMEMVGKGPGKKGAVWVAVRIPDDCISGHANQSRITTFPLNDKDNCLYAADVISLAREKGYFDGKDEEFSFRDAYNPLNFGSIRHCDARVWSFFNHYSKAMGEYLDYAQGDTTKPSFPLYIKPDRKVSLRDLKNDMRDHFENTPLDMTNDLGAGPWKMPYRPSPLSFKDKEGNSYFYERPIATPQTAFTLVGQLRSWLPDELGGIMWFGCDDANMIAYTPVYCGTYTAPKPYAVGTTDAATFSTESAFWICNMVSNMVYPRYAAMIADLRKVQERLEDAFENEQDEVTHRALAMNAAERKAYLNGLTGTYTEQMMTEWKQLAAFLIVKHNDMVRHVEHDGKFEKVYDEKCAIVRDGYPADYQDAMARDSGNRFLMKD